MPPDKKTFQAQSRQLPLDAACIVVDLLDSIGQRLSSTEGLNDENIHFVRKTCKKLRAVLRLLRPALDNRKVKDTDARIRAFAKQLAGARDSTVLLSTVDRLTAHFGALLAPDALAEIRTLLAAGMGPQHSPAPDIPSMQSELTAIRDGFARMDYSDVSVDTLVDGITASYRRGRKALALLGQQPDDEPAHVLRRYSKYLYNQYTFITGLNPEILKPLVDDFHTLEDQLGLVHDLTVLIETARSLADNPLHRELVIALAESRWLSLLSDAMRLAHRLYGRKTSKQLAWLKENLARAALPEQP